MNTRVTASMVLATVLVLMTAAIAVAEDQVSNEQKNEISIDLAAPAASLFALPDNYVIPILLNYQRVVADSWVLSIVPGIVIIHISDAAIRDSLAGQLWVELDWHSSGGLKGFFIGPAAAVVALGNVVSSGMAVGLFAVVVGASVGYQVPIFSNMSLDFALGLAGGPAYLEGRGTMFIPFARATIALGYRF